MNTREVTGFAVVPQVIFIYEKKNLHGSFCFPKGFQRSHHHLLLVGKRLCGVSLRHTSLERMLKTKLG